MEQGRREDSVRKLLILSGMRWLAKTVEWQKKNMAVVFDVRDNEVPGPVIRQRREEGREEGLQEGLEQGREQGSRRVVPAVLQQRFGKLPRWATERPATRPLSQTEFAVKVLSVNSLDELRQLLTD
jgi:predicted transposase YdaD